MLTAAQQSLTGLAREWRQQRFGPYERKQS